MFTQLLGIGLSLLALNTQAADSVVAPRATKTLALDIVNVAPGKVLAVGERGHILLSNDEGKSWSQKAAPTRATLTSIANAGPHILVGGHDGVLLMSRDAGETWVIVREQPEDEKPVLDIVFTDEKTGFAVGAYGLFLKTTDGGYRWLQQDIPQLEIPDFGFPHLYQMLSLNDGSLMVIGEAGFLARSSDGGATWATIPLPYEGTLFAATQTDKNTLIVAGMRGNAFRSADMGQTWTEINLDIRSGLNHIQFANGKIIIGGMDGVALISADDGMSFSLTQRSNRKAISASVLSSSGELLVAAEDGLHALSIQSDKE